MKRSARRSSQWRWMAAAVLLGAGGVYAQQAQQPQMMARKILKFRVAGLRRKRA